MLNILLVDDHELMRMGLRLLLQMEPGWQVCGEAGNARDAVALAREHKPAVAIVDVNMPDVDGLAATTAIRDASPQTEVILFTGFGTDELARQVRAVGGRGYVLKSEASTQVVSAVRAIAGELAPLSDRTPAPVRKFTRTREPRPELTAREREIAQLLAEGKSNWSIGTILGISVKTVETHRANIMSKLQLESIVELVHYAVRNELVTP